MPKIPFSPEDVTTTLNNMSVFVLMGIKDFTGANLQFEYSEARMEVICVQDLANLLVALPSVP